MKSLLLLPATLLYCLTMAAQVDTLSTHPLDGVVVTGTRTVTDVRHLPFTVDVVGHPQLTVNQRASVLPTLMEEVPGLMLTSRGMMGYGVSTNAAGGLSLRGISAGTGQMMVLIDGHPQYNGVYGHPISDSYQTMIADRVEVLRGPASMLYGSNAMGGVINIVTRGMHEDGEKTTLDLGAGSWGTFRAEAASQVRRGRLSTTWAAQYGRSDNQRPRMGFEQYGGYLKLDYNLAPHWNAWLNANVTHFNASNPGPVESPLFDARQWITRGEASAGIDNDYGWTNGRLSVYDNFGRHKINDGTTDPVGNPPTRYFRSRDALAGVSWYQSARLFAGNRTTLGVDYQHIYGRAFYTSIATGEVLDTPNKQSGHAHSNEVAGYADFRQDITTWLTLDAGIRLDHHSVTGSEWVPQGGLVLRPVATGALKLMASKGFRNPTMKDLYLYPPSNTELKPERLMSYELSWRQTLPRFDYGVNLYYIKGDNMIQTAVVDGRPRSVNTGAIENSGIEVEARWHVGDHLQIATNHSVLHMVHHVLAAPEYKGYLGATWRQGVWTVTGGIQQVAGLFTTTGSDATENFTLLHATVNCQVARWLGLWVKGDNLLAQKYEINAGFPMPRATFMGGVSISL